MAQKKKNSRNNGSWKQERASVNSKQKNRPKSNKYRPESDQSKRPNKGTASQYWRAGYTRKDGTRVKGHYVQKQGKRRSVEAFGE